MQEVRDYTADQAVVLGAQLCDAGRLDEAEGVFRAILKIAPEYFHALQRLGVTLAKKKQWYEALYRLDRALTIDRKSALVRGNRGMVLQQLGHTEEACAEFERALAIDPSNPLVLSNLGNVRERQGRYAEAMTALNRSLAIDPAATTYYNRGIVQVRLRDHAAAIADFARALALEPDHAEAHFNLGMVSLLRGDYARGFREYEWRWETAEYATYRGRFPQPKWLGESDIAGKSILVYGDQGLGDALMFARYLPLLADSGARVHLIAHPGLEPLWERTFSDWATYRHHRKGDPMPAVDYRISLPSLPLAYGTTIDSVPAPMRMFRGHEHAVAKLAEWVHRDGRDSLKVGLCWSGNWTHANDAHRSIAFAEFRTVLAQVGLDRADFFSLQYEVREMDKPALATVNVVDLGLADWFDTMAAIALMDVVVSVDTSVLHMAGSLGVETFALIPAFGTDWRWGLSGDHSPWYPAMRLFRQDRPGSWTAALRRVADALKQHHAANYVPFARMQGETCKSAS